MSARIEERLMVQDYYRDLTRKLREAGYIKVPGGKGSHEKWRNGEGHQVTVPRLRTH